jgi:hypothetical protein
MNPNGSRVGDVDSRSAAAVSPNVRRYLAGAFAAIVVLCLGTGAAWALPHTPAQLQRALKVWAHFPADASTRPVVLIGDDDVNAPSGGFPDDDHKIAFLDGYINAPTTYPSGPASVDHFPIMSAAEAFDVLQGPPAKVPNGTMKLNVTSIDFGSGLFQTDRGMRRLPAWLFQFQGVKTLPPCSLFLERLSSPLVIPAIESRRWEPRWGPTTARSRSPSPVRPRPMAHAMRTTPWKSPPRRPS